MATAAMRSMSKASSTAHTTNSGFASRAGSEAGEPFDDDDDDNDNSEAEQEHKESKEPEGPPVAFIMTKRPSTPMPPYSLGDGIDVYLDGIRFLPACLRLVKVCTHEPHSVRVRRAVRDA
jgi:hypothetical protein